MQVFNTCIACFSFLVLFPDLGWRLSRGWYAVGGALIVNVMLGDFLFILPLLEFIRPDGAVNRACRAPRARTQLQMDRLYTLHASLYLSFRAQLSGKFVVICIMFASAIPILYLIGAGYFWLALWIDRFNLLRRIVPPPRTGPHLTLSLTLLIFPMAVLLHSVMSVFFFEAIILGGRRRR